MNPLFMLAIFLTTFFLCCNQNHFEDKSTFGQVHQKIYQDDVELLFRMFLFKYGRFPLSISEIADSAQNESSTIEWVSIKMTDPFSENNEPFQYLSLNEGREFLLISRGPDHKLNQYDTNLNMTSVLNASLLLTDSECTDTTNYRKKDIIVLCGEAKSMLIANSKIIDNTTEYFDDMIAQNKRYTYSIKQVLLHIEPKTHSKQNIKIDSTNSFIDIIHNGCVFKFFLSEYMNAAAMNAEITEQNFTISGVYSGYDEDQNIFIYKHCFYEQRKPIDAKNEYIKKREGSAFNINRCFFSLNSSIKQ